MIPSEIVSISYACNGSTISFPITFTFDAATEIRVWLRTDATEEETELDNPTHFSILGYNVVTVQTYADGYTLVIKRDPDLKQESDYIPGGAMPAEDLENDFDKLAKIVQRLKEKLTRAAILPESSPYSDIILPEPSEDGYLKYISGALCLVDYLSSGNYTVQAFMKSFLESLTVAKAQENLGLVDADQQVSNFIKTLLNDADAATARETLDVYSISESNALKPKLPVGTILMYNGTGIADAGTRTTKLGDEGGDTISDIPYGNWYVCNGNASTPNLLNKFVRSEAASGNTGGEDSHTLSESEMPSHNHTQNAHRHQLMSNANNSDNCMGFGHGSCKVVGGNQYYATYHADVPAGQPEYPLVNNQQPYILAKGGGEAHENRPLYYSAIFIIRMS
jgi:microcystin-dependent protein